MSINIDVIIVLASLRAEGTPRMALDLCRSWMEWGIQPLVLNLKRGKSEMRPQFERMNIPIESVPVGHEGYRRYLRLARASYRLCKHYRPRAVLCMPFGLHSFVAIGAYLAGVRHIGVHVGNPPSPTENTRQALVKFRRIVAIGRPFTRRVVCCSNYVLENAVVHLKIPRKMTEVVYNGIGFEAFAEVEKKKSLAQQNHIPVIGMVGTLEGHKDQDTLIRAAAILKNRGVLLDVRLIGDGHRRDSLSNLIEKLSAPVQLMGSRDDIPSQMTAMDVFVFSTTPLEGLGIALIEAMAASIPVIASDVPACREVLEGGALATLVPPRDPRALADAIVTTLLNQEIARAKAVAAQEKVHRHFSSVGMAQRYAQILNLSAGADDQIQQS